MEEKQSNCLYIITKYFDGAPYVELETVQDILNEKDKLCKAYNDISMYLIAEREMNERLKSQLTDYEKRLKEETQKNFELQETIKRMTEPAELCCCECDSDDEVDLEEVIYEQQCEIERLNIALEVLVDKFGGESW